MARVRGVTSDSLPWPERQPDFEQERVLAAARRELFDRIPTAPTMIGRYRIDRRVGAGGMGEVYLGFDIDLQRSVAIKLVLPQSGATHGPQRLRREALALARLSHPNVVQVYEVGEHEGQTFLAMELIEGETLADWLAAGQRSWKETLERFLAAGRGLAAAHAAGIIHRDFKPENVPMTREGRVCVADFGLAWTEDSIPPMTTDEVSQPTSGERLSTTGAVLGTVRYMPLEQIRGERVDARADQFAFCVALYEALWRISPFPAESVDARRRALETTAATRPPRGRVPRGLWWVIRRGLSREPNRRWPDMRALVSALEMVPQRRRWLAIGGLLVATGGLLLATLMRPEPCGEVDGMLDGSWNDERRAALFEAFAATERPFAKATAAPTLAALDSWRLHWIVESQNVCLATMAEQLPEESLGVRRACLDDQRESFAATVETLMAADVEGITNAFELVAGLPDPRVCGDEQGFLLDLGLPSKEQEERVAGIRRMLAHSRAHRLAGYPARAEELAEPALREARALGHDPLLAEALAEWGKVADAMAQYSQAVEALQDAADLAEANHHDLLLAEIWLDLAELGTRNDPMLGAFWLRRAEATNERVKATSLDRSRLVFLRGELAFADGKLDIAESEYHLALDLLPDDSGPAVSNWRYSYMRRLAYVVQVNKGPEAARDLYRQFLAETEATFGQEHPKVALPMFFLAQLLEDSPEGPELLERAATLARQSTGQSQVMLGNALVGLAQVAANAGDLERAEQLVEEADQAFEHIRSSRVANHAMVSMMRGYVAEERGEYHTAFDAYDRAIEQFGPRAGAGHPNVMGAQAGAGRCLRKLRRWEEARTRFEASLGPRRPGQHEPKARLGLAALDLHAGDPTAAQHNLNELRDQPPGESERLEVELIRAVAALRLGRRPMDPSEALRAALKDEEHPHHRYVNEVSSEILLTNHERGQLGID